MKQIARKYNVVDLFAGAGGLSYGFIQTGRFGVIAAFEKNSNAQKTYLNNHGNSVVMYSDVEYAVTEEAKEKLGYVDVIIGGPPCQGFSNANRQKNHAINQNNSLVKKYVQAILNLEPKAFVMENVSMLQSETHKFFVEKIDEDIIKQYSIATSPNEIKLLDEALLFDDAIEIASNREKISNYIWTKQDYHTLNVVYKTHNSDKLEKALNTHRTRLLKLAIKLVNNRDKEDYILNVNNLAGDAIQQYYACEHTSESARILCKNIEPAIMIQRMLSKAKEIHDNNIVVSEYSQERGLFAKVTSMAVIDYIEAVLGSDSNGYAITKGVLSATEFGAPQKRMRFVIAGIKKSISKEIILPRGTFNESEYRTVRDAIEDIECIEVATKIEEGNAGIKFFNAQEVTSQFARYLRDSDTLYNHVSTETTDVAKERFVAIKQGENFHSLPPNLKTTYTDVERTQNTIYLRLKYDEPSGTVLNVRKSMWIHPTLNRAISIREAARLQTFPDSFVFYGTKDAQYQQIGNAVPPIMARALANHLCTYLDDYVRRN